MATLVDQWGNPVRTQELTKTIAAPTLAGVRTIWTDSIASGLTPESLASILRSAVEGDHLNYLTLAEEMEERDLHYAAELSKRKLAVSRLPVTVEAISDEQKDIDIADAVRALVAAPGFRFLIKDLLDALGKGYSVCEIDWAKDRTITLSSGVKRSAWVPRGYPHRDPRFFQFDLATHAEIRLRDESDLMNGVALAPYKFVQHVARIKTGLPIRGGLARLAAWAHMCKGYTVKDWLAFAEVFGMPLRMGKYGPGASPADINILRMAVANLGSDAAAVFPESMKIELVEATKGSSDKVFLMLADWLDAQVSKGILGQTASASGTPGKLGDEKLQAEVRDDIRDDDAEQLEETLNRDLVRAFVDLNFGPQEQYPTLQIRAAEKDDIGVLVDALEKLVPLGLRVEQSVVRDKIGLPDPDEKTPPEDLLGAPKVATPVEGKDKAANREGKPVADPGQSAIDGLLASFSDEALNSEIKAVLMPLIQELRAAGDYDTALERLAEAYPAMNSEGLQEMMARMIFIADIWGRIDAGR